ncbi:hypothetical protein M8C21_004785 [Ambrosia artemisiifolia]|uniref:Uncharacterized protein n=1 Tax=Ambrosia artemisiifolia TaxID=4212 RepID=A0AAD5BNX2_AMBAR|nr:hypothetical protein M8C21_004785 [Ambrosia artemisiifolia]
MNVSTCEGNDVQCGVNNNVMVPKSSKDNTTVDMMDSKKSDGVEDVEHCDKVETGKVYIGVLRGKNVYIRANKKIGTKGDEGKVINDGNVDDIIKDVIVNTEADVVERRRSKRTKVVDNTVPSFNLLSQSSLESDLEDDEMGIQEVNLNRPLEDEEKLLWQYLLTTVVDKERVDRKKDFNDNESIDIELEKKEVKMSFMKKIFETDYGLTTMTYLITSLREGKEVKSNVIDCRASILNFNERKLKTEGKRRLCCYATTIPGFMLEMRQTKEKAFATVKSHLREVEVIDSMVSNKGLYTMKVGTKFSDIGSPCKVVCL